MSAQHQLPITNYAFATLRKRNDMMIMAMPAMMARNAATNTSDTAAPSGALKIQMPRMIEITPHKMIQTSP